MDSLIMILCFVSGWIAGLVTGHLCTSLVTPYFKDRNERSDFRAVVPAFSYLLSFAISLFVVLQPWSLMKWLAAPITALGIVIFVAFVFLIAVAFDLLGSIPQKLRQARRATLDTINAKTQSVTSAQSK